MIIRKITLILSAVFFSSCFTFAQSLAENKIYEAYDDMVGLDNTGLYNGTEFKDVYLNTDDSYRFFEEYNFTKGNIFYNGQFYSNVLLKYDVYEDNIITHSDDNLSIFNVTLVPEFVSSFSLYGRNFVRLTDTGLNLDGNNFFEIAYKGTDINLYIKHIKKKKDKALKSGIQYSFSDDNFYLLKTENEYYIVNSVKDIRNAIPQNDNQIRDFYKTYKSLYKSNLDRFMLNLVKYLDGLKENTANR